MMKIKENMPDEVKKVIINVNKYLENPDRECIYEDLDFVKEMYYWVHYDEKYKEWIVSSNFEETMTPVCVFNNGKWFYREYWSGDDIPYIHGTNEVISDLIVSIFP